MTLSPVCLAHWCWGDVYMTLHEHISLHSRSLAVILLFNWFELKKNWLVFRMRPPHCFAPLRGEDKFARMIMVLGFIEIRFYGPRFKKFSHWNSPPSATNVLWMTIYAPMTVVQPVGHALRLQERSSETFLAVSFAGNTHFAHVHFCSVVYIRTYCVLPS